ncbi:MAG: hypothetical protein LUD72_11185 [Bacteroidales bacterium]|nr:hypothetical protein [Bacteroidales bacterium]
MKKKQESIKNEGVKLLQFAERELKCAGYTNGGANEWTARCVMELLKTFVKQRHNSKPFPYVADLFYRLTKKELLSPLTLAIDEFEQTCEDLWQNKREPSIFKNSDDGTPYNLHAFIRESQQVKTLTDREPKIPDVPRQSYGEIYELKDGVTTGRHFLNCYIKKEEIDAGRYIPKPQIIVPCLEVEASNGNRNCFVEADLPELAVLEASYEVGWMTDERLKDRKV